MAKMKKNKEHFSDVSDDKDFEGNSVNDELQDEEKPDDSSEEKVEIHHEDDEDFSELEERVKNLEKEKSELEDLLKRQKAEFDNFRRRVNEERKSFKLKANEDLLLGLLSILDNFDSALHVKTDDPKLKSFLEGFHFIEKQFVELLEKNNVSLSAEIGGGFNHDFHRALDFEQGEDDEDTISEIYKKGYICDDRVLRLADVRVKKKKLENKKK